ncbi:MAG: adenosine kinase [Bacteroidales bacterium]|nr:adenosine kinase [Bacteroidales bacterium]
MKRILGIGNALVDVLTKVDNEQILSELHLPKGSMQLLSTEAYAEVTRRMLALPTKLTTGGSACNTLLALSHLDAPTGMIGKIGDDENGRFFASYFAQRGISTRLLHDSRPTGVASTFITPDGQRTFGTYLGAAARLTADELQQAWFEGYDYFYIEGYLVQNHDLVLRAIELAHAAGCEVCLDLASYNIVEADLDFFRALMPSIDIVFANEQEAQALTGLEARAALDALAATCHMAVVKIGKHGVWACHGTEVAHCQARDVPVVVDTTAAGDYFAAGFMHALAAGEPLATCIARGSLLAGHIIEVVGTELPDATWQQLRLQCGLA